jgi:hypothetical protein
MGFVHNARINNQNKVVTEKLAEIDFAHFVISARQTGAVSNTSSVLGTIVVMDKVWYRHLPARMTPLVKIPNLFS